MNPVFFGQNQIRFVTFSDDFNRSNNDDMGSNWDSVDGDTDIISNTARFTTTGANIIMWGLPTNDLTQWGKLTVGYVANAYTNHFGFYFRVTDTVGYAISFDSLDDEVTFAVAEDIGGSNSSSTIDTTGLAIAVGDTFGFTIQGTGPATIIRIWRNPTGLPISAANWDGNTSPDVVFEGYTDENWQDTGLYLGLFGAPAVATNNLAIDNWFGGTCPN